MRTIYSLILLAAVFVLSSCSHSRHPDSLWYDPNDPGYEYAPAMYHSWPYEPLTQVTDEDATSWHYNSTPYNDYDGKYKSNSLTPVEGTVAYGKLDFYFPFENSPAGRTEAGDQMENPIELTELTMNEGRRLYNLYCDHCHGEKGDGNGSIMEAGKLPTMGAYYDKLKDRRAGEIFHTITYGKGIMGAHGSQVSPEHRWLIVNWVQIMQKGPEAYKTRTMDDYRALVMAEQGSEEEAEKDSTITSEEVVDGEVISEVNQTN